MRKLLTISIVTSCTLLVGCQHKLVINGREQWIRQELPALVSFKPTNETAALHVENVGNHVTRIHGHKGFVPLESGQWFFFTSYSSHTALPDLIIAIDHEGMLHASNGHVCPDLILSWPRESPSRKLETINDLVSSSVSLKPGGKGTDRWIRVDHWQQEIPNQRMQR